MSFDKLHLMRDEEYKRLRQKQVQSYNPELRLLTKLDDDMNEILNDTTVPVDVKMRIYDHIRDRFKDVKAASKVAPRHKIETIKEVEEPVTEEEEEEEEVEPDYQPMEADVLTGVSKLKKPKAKTLLKMIQANPDIIAINKKNEIVLHGEPVEGSNYFDLVHSLYDNRVAGDSPSGNLGHTKFLKALRDINVPSSLISTSIQNQKLSKLKHHSPIKSPNEFASPLGSHTPTTTMKGKGFPPGIRQHMLKLYRV